MPRKRSTTAIDDFADGIVESLFERGAEMIGRVREQQHAQIQLAHPEGTLYICAGCKKPFLLDQCQMVDPRPQKNPDGQLVYFGQCVGCWNFMLKAGQEKVSFLQRRAQQAKANGGAPPPGAAPQRAPTLKPPWEVLGISVDASVDEIRKAARKLAVQYHDDRLNGVPGITAEQRAAARETYEEIMRCRDAMLKVRGVTGAAGAAG